MVRRRWKTTIAKIELSTPYASSSSAVSAEVCQSAIALNTTDAGAETTKTLSTTDIWVKLLTSWAMR